MSKKKFCKKLGAMVSTLLMGASLGGGYRSFAMQENVGEQINVAEMGQTSISKFCSVSAEEIYEQGVVYIGYDGEIRMHGIKQTDLAEAHVYFVCRDKTIGHLTINGEYGQLVDYKLGNNLLKEKVEELNKKLEALWQKDQNNRAVENQNTEIIEKSNVDLEVLQQDKQGSASLNTVNVDNSGANSEQNKQSDNAMSKFGTLGLTSGLLSFLLYKFL